MTEPVILGRQPATCYITPSKPNPWYGSIIGGVKGKLAVTGGERFTAEQTAAMREQGFDPGQDEVITITRNATTRELYWPKGSPPPQFQFDCPVLCRRNGHVKILSPSGLIEWVGPDGFAGRSPATKGKMK